MLITGRKEIPYLWIVMITIPFAASQFIGAIWGTCFIFSIKKFLDDPAQLAFLFSIPPMVNLVLKAYIAYSSDLVWTRFGRRKPFLAVAQGIHICTLLALPLAPTLGIFLTIWAFHSIFGVFSMPWEPLKLEVVPPQQRGTSSALSQAIGNAKNLLFYVVIFGRYDDAEFMGSFTVTGEMTLFWIAMVLMALVLGVVTLGIKELKPTGPIKPRGGLVAAFKAIIDPDLRRVYILIFGHAMLGAGLGFMGNLLYTEQWGYSKQEMGTNIAIGAVINIFLALLIGRLADSGNRMRIFQIGIGGALVMKVLYFTYITFVLPDQRPSLAEMVLFGEVMAIFGLVAATVYYPLVYDYVERNRMGTYAAGAGIVSDLTHLVTLNGVGLFVKYASALTMAPGGEMVRVSVHETMPQAQVRQLVEAHAWKDPATGEAIPAKRIDARAYYATGFIRDHGRTWEIRYEDPTARELAEKRDKIEADRAAAARSEVAANDDAIRLGKADLEPDAKTQERIARLKEDASGYAKTKIELAAQVDAIKKQLADRSQSFRGQVEAAFAGKEVADGEQVLGVGRIRAVVVRMAANDIEREPLESLLSAWRAGNPQAIDLRGDRNSADKRLLLIASIVIAEGADPAVAANETAAQLGALAQKRAPDLLPARPEVLGHEVMAGVTLDLATAEEPVEVVGSPVTRGYRQFTSWFGEEYDPLIKLSALAKTLRGGERPEIGALEHVRVLPRTEPCSGIRIVGLPMRDTKPSKKQPAPEPGVYARIDAALEGDPALAGTVRALYHNVVKEAKGQSLTVVRPVIAAEFAAMKWNYFIGYVWMFLLGCIGLGITFYFVHLERRGIIRKLGKLEHDKS